MSTSETGVPRREGAGDRKGSRRDRARLTVNSKHVDRGHIASTSTCTQRPSRQWTVLHTGVALLRQAAPCSTARRLYRMDTAPQLFAQPGGDQRTHGELSVMGLVPGIGTSQTRAPSQASAAFSNAAAICRACAPVKSPSASM